MGGVLLARTQYTRELCEYKQCVESAISRGQIMQVHAYSQLDSRAIRKWFASDTRAPFNLLVDGTVALKTRTKASLSQFPEVCGFEHS